MNNLNSPPHAALTPPLMEGLGVAPLFPVLNIHALLHRLPTEFLSINRVPLITLNL